MTLRSLASGSAGNSLYVASADGETRILIDAGLSFRKLRNRISAAGLPALPGIKAVFVTHSHGDHIGKSGSGATCVERLIREYGIRVYGTAPTLDAAGVRQHPQAVTIGVRAEIEVGPLRVWAFPIRRHNAEECVNYRVYDGASKRTMLQCFETGAKPDGFDAWLPHADALLIECNHEREYVVDNDKIPEIIAQRIIATHLSNPNAAAIVKQISERTKLVVALHLSKENNDPALVRVVLTKALREIGREDVRVVIAGQDKPSEVLNL